MKTSTLPQVERIPETLPRAQELEQPDSATDVLIVGAGPAGMACAIETQKAGFKALIIDKGCLVNSIYHYPNNMVFFTTPELLEIGNVPFTTALPKPTRLEALEYYRRVAKPYDLNIHQYEWVKTITGEDNDFRVTTTDRSDAIHDYKARKIVLATGYYDLANEIGIPGEELDKVFITTANRSLFRQRCGSDRRQEFSGRSRSGPVASWRTRHARPSRAADTFPRQILGAP